MDDIYFPPVVRYRFRVRALAPIKLPPYTGSTWRGLLATALRRSVCVPELEHCDACIVQTFCAFYRFFEHGALTDEQDPRYRSNTLPFVLDLLGDGGRLVDKGDPIIVGLTIIGDSIAFLPFWVYAFQRAGDIGIGRDRGRFELLEVTQEWALGSDRWQPVWRSDRDGLAAMGPEPVAFPELPSALDIELLTPLRIKRKAALVGVQDFTAAEFLRHLCARLDRLEQQFGHRREPLFWPAHRALIEALPPGATDVRWHDWTRYSSRQQQYMKFGGLVGSFRIPQQALPDLWSIVWLGQWLHVGKNTTFGLGAYRARFGN